MNLTVEQTIYVYEKIKSAYPDDIRRIDDYFLSKKKQRMDKIGDPILGESLTDYFFSDYSINPEDMDFTIDINPNEVLFKNLLEITSSHSINNSPGRKIKFFVKEKNTKKIVGFVQLGSPILNNKPRNLWLGKTPNLKIYNHRSIT